MWKVIGEFAVARYVVQPDANSNVELERGMVIQSLSELTGLSIATIFQIFDENWNFFDVGIWYHPKMDGCSYHVELSRQYLWFLRDENRSGILHLPFRNNVVRAYRRRIADMMKSEKLFATRSFRMLDVLIHSITD